MITFRFNLTSPQENYKCISGKLVQFFFQQNAENSFFFPLAFRGDDFVKFTTIDHFPFALSYLIGKPWENFLLDVASVTMETLSKTLDKRENNGEAY